MRQGNMEGKAAYIPFKASISCDERFFVSLIDFV